MAEAWFIRIRNYLGRRLFHLAKGVSVDSLGGPSMSATLTPWILVPPYTEVFYVDEADVDVNRSGGTRWPATPGFRRPAASSPVCGGMLSRTRKWPIARLRCHG